MGPEDTLHSGWGRDFAPFLGMDKLGTRAGKTPDPNQADLHPAEFSGQNVPKLVLQMSKAMRCDYYLGSAGMNLVYQDPCVSFCKLIPSSLSQSDSQWLSHADFPAIHEGQDHNRSSCKVIHDAGEGKGTHCPPLGSLFPLEKLEAQERPFLMVLQWPG